MVFKNWSGLEKVVLVLT